MAMTIEATEYTREDGLKAIRLHNSTQWVIRQIIGPAWFYSDVRGKWVIITNITNLEEFGMTFERAMELLNSLLSVKIRTEL